MCTVYTDISDIMYLWGTHSPTDVLTSKTAGFGGWLSVGSLRMTQVSVQHK